MFTSSHSSTRKTPDGVLGGRVTSWVQPFHTRIHMHLRSEVPLTDRMDLSFDEMSTYIRDGPYCTYSLITSPFPGDSGRITALARLRYRRHTVFGFSHTFGSFTLLAALCIWFFAYNRLVYVTGGTLYSVFRIHSARLRYRRHIVFGFSHTFVRKLDWNMHFGG
jgi:hypothetical protein